jgi:hypothetical protein
MKRGRAAAERRASSSFALLVGRLVIKILSALTTVHQTVSLCVFVSIELIHPPRRALYSLDDEEYIVRSRVCVNQS